MTGTAVQEKNLSLPSNVLIALVTLKAIQDSKTKNINVATIGTYLCELRNLGIELGGVSLTYSFGEYYSSDVAKFLAEGVVFGDVIQYDPLIFNEGKCSVVCKNAIRELVEREREFEPIIRVAQKILGIPPFQF